jgi:hypothetical protein
MMIGKVLYLAAGAARGPGVLRPTRFPDLSRLPKDQLPSFPIMFSGEMR